MQRDMFMATLINDRARPVVALPLSMRIRSADRISETLVQSGDVVGEGDDPCAALCRELVRLGVPETHLQVYDGRVACFFMSISEIASEIPASAGKQISANPGAGEGGVSR
jgi:hypothetical protein